MRKFYIIFLLIANFCQAQVTTDALVHIDEFFKDAIFFSDKFITPATDAAAYQAASGWVFSARKRKLWSTTLGVHANVFFVPNEDRDFVLNDSDFTFLKIMSGTSAVVPTALGNDNQVRIIDRYGIISVMQPIKTPKGVDQEQIFYPHLSASLAIWQGTEIIAKYAPKTKINKGEYEVYGLGLKHNLSQYIPVLKKNKMNLAMTISKSKENISFDFLDIPTTIGTLGINRINGNVDTWQFQTNFSKEFGKFEFMVGSMINYSDFKYNFSGEKGTATIKINNLDPQDYFNESIKSIYKSKLNCIYEASLTFNYKKIYFQSAVAFSKFVNTNFSVHYQFN